MIQNYCKFGNSHDFSPLDLGVNAVYRVPLVCRWQIPNSILGIPLVHIGGGYLIPLTSIEYHTLVLESTTFCTKFGKIFCAIFLHFLLDKTGAAMV